MTDSHVAPAGWYPQPDGTFGQRWWDGARWTEHTSPIAPPSPALPQYDAIEKPQVPEGTTVDTPWIWLIVMLPLVGLIPLFFWDLEGYMLRSMTDPLAQVGLYFDPWYLTTVALGWITYGVMVWFAFLDVKALRALGYARQFHWAWAFLSSLVYVIGRSVVVKKQARRGMAPMWVVIALNVAMLIGIFVWTGVIIANVVSASIATFSSYSTM
ncbi:DUF2510 domain-containing protein [Agromyces sp. NPDC058484]|uniref:DUF2510 domain-containing protein n=1 Tax=Agromyces sp. NPDC058484 TaxID=3346524 RepID=UPI0036563646